MFILRNSLFLICFSALISFCESSYANSNNKSDQKKQLLLQKIAQAPQFSADKNQWIQLFEQPGNSQHYYLANKKGQIYQLEQDSPKSTTLLVDLPLLFPKNSILHLDSFTLHPNFSRRDQAGFQTFYTAHVEDVQGSNNQNRMHESKISTPLIFDAVIIEWQLNAAKQVDPKTQREVMRIAIDSPENGINQLSFNPYIKSWQENFSQLYISLSASQKMKRYPLYSGAILRIQPWESITGSYSVPHSNPYYANEHINKAIYMFGAGQVQQFIWPDRYSTQLLISHQSLLNNTKELKLSYSNGGDDWRQKTSKALTSKNTKAPLPNNLLVYRGQNAPALRNKLLLLTNNKQQWQLNSLPLEITVEQIKGRDQKDSVSSPPSSPIIEWQLDQQELQANQLSLYRDNRGELLFFNEDTGIIYQVFQQDSSQTLPKNESSSSNTATLFFVILLCLLISYITYQIKYQQKSVKSLVRREFATLALTEDKLAINLFKRHQRTPEKSILLQDINQCQLLLNDLVITTINATLEHGFNAQQEKKLRDIFHTEQIPKMVDGKVRSISLVLGTKGKGKHLICLYLRKGSDRITKNSYFEVIDNALDWCWLIANKINGEHTGQRALNPRVSATVAAQTDHKSHDHTPLHTQAAISRPNNVGTVAISNDAATQAGELLKSQKISISQSQLEQHDMHEVEVAKVEADLVNAIEKLGKLQQQGFLSDDEFSQAKAKLLARLHNTE
jgi:hypothetical protein